MWTKFIFPSFFFCKVEEVPANMPHPYEVSWPPSSWKMFALLIFSEISETGTKNSSPPPSVTSDRTIALTMESIRCGAPSLNPVYERLSIPLTGKGIIQCHLSCPLQKLTREHGWIFHRVWCHLLVLLIPPISLVKMLSEHDNRVVMTAGEALASPPLLCLRLFLLLFLQHYNWNLKKLDSQENIKKKKKKKNIFQSVCYSSEASSWGDGLWRQRLNSLNDRVVVWKFEILAVVILAMTFTYRTKKSCLRMFFRTNQKTGIFWISLQCQDLFKKIAEEGDLQFFIDS